MKHIAIKLIGCLSLLTLISACTDGASVTAGADGTSEGAAFDFSGIWNGVMTPNPNNAGATPANLNLSITQNSVPVETGGDEEDEETNTNNQTRIDASGVANIDGNCWDGGPIQTGDAAGTTVTFTVSESEDADASITFSGQFVGDRIEGNFFSRGGECGNISGTWSVQR